MEGKGGRGHFVKFSMDAPGKCESCCLFESSSLSSLAHCVCVCVRVMEYPSHLFLPSLSHTNFISCSLLARDGANAQFEKRMSSHIKEANTQIICFICTYKSLL